MPYQLFHNLFPEKAERETRSIIVLENSDSGLPPGEYGFLEMFCNEVDCDCRRAFFYVVSSLREDVEAVIAWGWETADFYAQWMGDDDPLFIAEMQGPTLNLTSPRTDLAPAILDLFRDVLLRDEAYLARVKRHYKMFRKKIDGGSPGKSRSRRARRKRKGCGSSGTAAARG
jgi:hypothetical protein